LPPKRMGKCDKDGADLEQRSDDCAEVFQMRLDVFKRETEPLIRYYRDRNLWIQVDAELPPSTVTEDIVSRLTQCRMQLSR
jgi:adenylate kinase